jgi:hypothetical protein
MGETPREQIFHISFDIFHYFSFVIATVYLGTSVILTEPSAVAPDATLNLRIRRLPAQPYFQFILTEPSAVAPDAMINYVE